jgi:hypothetical protein
MRLMMFVAMKFMKKMGFDDDVNDVNDHEDYVVVVVVVVVVVIVTDDDDDNNNHNYKAYRGINVFMASRYINWWRLHE